MIQVLYTHMLCKNLKFFQKKIRNKFPITIIVIHNIHNTAKEWINEWTDGWMKAGKALGDGNQIFFNLFRNCLYVNILLKNQ